MNSIPSNSVEMIDRTSQLIIERFNVTREYAERLAIGALSGIEAHGGDSTDWVTVVNTVDVVVASWVENGVSLSSK